MRLRYSERFLEALADAPPNVRRTFYKQSRFLMQNLRHPSLHAKKYDEAHNVWQARVNKDWRFFFTIEKDTYHLQTIMSHPK